MLLADLEEAPTRDLPARAVELVQDAEHHLRPPVAGAVVQAEVESRAPRLVGGRSQEPLDPLETAFRVQQLHVLHRRTPSGRRSGSPRP
jgi:hypothetical protein